jgi:hypothetical protein
MGDVQPPIVCDGVRLVVLRLDGDRVDLSREAEAGHATERAHAASGMVLAAAGRTRERACGLMAAVYSGPLRAPEATWW